MEDKGISYKNFKFNNENNIIWIILVSAIFSLLISVIISVLITLFTNNWFQYIIGIVIFWILFVIMFYFWKKVINKISNERIKKNYDKLSCVDWTSIYSFYNTSKIKINNIKINTFYIPIYSIFKANNNEFDSESLNIIDIMHNEPTFKKFEINNSVNFEINNLNIEFLFEVLFLDENSNNIYCKIQITFFSKNIEEIIFNDFSDFLKKNKKSTINYKDNKASITIYKLIDRYDDLEELDIKNYFSETSNTLKKSINTISNIPGLFGLRKMNSKNINNKITNIIEMDCFLLEQFSFLY